MSRFYFPSKRESFWRRWSPAARRRARLAAKAWAAPSPGDRIRVEVGYRKKPLADGLEPLTGHVVASFTAEAGVADGEMSYRDHATGELHTDPISMLYDGESGVVMNLTSGEVVATVSNSFPGDDDE